MAFKPVRPPEQELHAGAVTVKLADGELRYLSAGGEELIRRIYFCVRDSTWDTAEANFDEYEVKQGSNSFRVELSAHCKNANADYKWKGVITGSETGEIVFSVQGEALRAFQSPRIGLCVLYGTQAVAGQKFEVSKDGKALPEGVFPVDVAQGALAKEYDTLSYESRAGLKVTCRLEEATFGMEDQRNFGDSSYKAYAGLPYPYPEVPEHELARQKVIIQVLGGGKEPTEPKNSVRVSLAKAPGEGKVPKLQTEPFPGKPADFWSVNNSSTDFSKMEKVHFGYNPSLHLRDDDTFVENIPALGDEVKSVRKLLPKPLPFWIGPIEFASPHPRPVSDPRNETKFGAAWTAAVIGELAKAGVEKAAFNVDGDPARAILEEFKALEGEPLIPAKIEADPGIHVAAFGIMTKEGPRLWLVNLSSDFREVRIDGEKGVETLEPWEVSRITPKNDAPAGPPASGATPRPLPRRPDAR